MFPEPDDPLRRAAESLVAAVTDALRSALLHGDAPMRDTPIPLPPHRGTARRTQAISAEHRAQREFLVGWFQSHGCRVLGRRQRWITLADPSGCHWQVATWRIYRLEGKARTHDLDALVLYALIGAGLEFELRPATLTAVLPRYGRIAGQLVRVQLRREWR